MNAELHLMKRCDGCGGYGRISLPESEREFLEGSGRTIQCPTCGGEGGSVEVLDPEMVLPGFGVKYISLARSEPFTVQHVIDALTEGKN